MADATFFGIAAWPPIFPSRLLETGQNLFPEGEISEIEGLMFASLAAARARTHIFGALERLHGLTGLIDPTINAASLLLEWVSNYVVTDGWTEEERWEFDHYFAIAGTAFDPAFPLDVESLHEILMGLMNYPEVINSTLAFSLNISLSDVTTAMAIAQYVLGVEETVASFAVLNRHRRYLGLQMIDINHDLPFALGERRFPVSSYLRGETIDGNTLAELELEMEQLSERYAVLDQALP